MALPVVDLPQPDSPTMPSVSPLARSRLTSLTAWTLPTPGGELDDQVLDLEHQVVGVRPEVGGARAGHQMPLSRTSKRARTWSPTKLRARIVRNMNSAGNSTMCGARSTCERPFWIMSPQLTPLTSPTPKKARAASTTIRPRQR